MYMTGEAKRASITRECFIDIENRDYWRLRLINTSGSRGKNQAADDELQPSRLQL